MMTNGADIQPWQQSIKPLISEATARCLVERLYGLRVCHMKSLESYDDINYQVIVDTVNHVNPNITEVWPHGYTLKILNSMDSTGIHVDGEHYMMQVLSQHDIHCPNPIPNVDGKDCSLEKITPYTEDAHSKESDKGTSMHVVRLLTHVPGIAIELTPFTGPLMYNVGKTVGAMDKALQGHSHPSLDIRKARWDLKSVPELRNFVHVLNEAQRELILSVVTTFEGEVPILYSKFNKGIIHADCNERNILVAASPATRVSAIIDFGDALISFYVFEIAITMMYMMDNKQMDPVETAGHVLAGYLSEHRLNPSELDALKACVCGRFAQSLTLGAYSYSLNPSCEYALRTAINGWSLLKTLFATPKHKLNAIWTNIINTYQSAK